MTSAMKLNVKAEPQLMWKLSPHADDPFEHDLRWRPMAPRNTEKVMSSLRSNSIDKEFTYVLPGAPYEIKYVVDFIQLDGYMHTPVMHCKHKNNTHLSISIRARVSPDIQLRVEDRVLTAKVDFPGGPYNDTIYSFDTVKDMTFGALMANMKGLWPLLDSLRLTTPGIGRANPSMNCKIGKWFKPQDHTAGQKRKVAKKKGESTNVAKKKSESTKAKVAKKKGESTKAKVAKKKGESTKAKVAKKPAMQSSERSK